MFSKVHSGNVKLSSGLVYTLYAFREDEGSHSENYSDSDDSEDGGTESDDEAEEFDGILSFENQQLKLNTAADGSAVLFVHI